MKSITSFSGDYRFLSNFYPTEIFYRNKVYASSEHAYMCQKTLDPELAEKIRLAETPGKAKRLGRAVELRPDWEQIKLRAIQEILEIKFSNLELKEKLAATKGLTLIEVNTWGDCYWGECPLGVGKTISVNF